MSKLSRVYQKLFGTVDATNNNVGVFGSLAAGSPTKTSNPSTMQSLSNWDGGWYSAVIGSNSPAIEDMNAIHYVFAYQLAYLMQSGIPEWDSSTTYYTGSFVQSAGVIYVSLVNNNTNNLLTDASKWALGITTASIRDSAITTPLIQDGAVTSSKLASSVLTGFVGNVVYKYQNFGGF